MLSKKRFLILNMENHTLWQPRTFPVVFQEALEREGDDWQTCEVADDQPLPADALEYYGIVITGSHFNCRERSELPWFDSVCQLIRDASDRGAPRIFGGCFGCQIIAYALGGEVDYNPNQRFVLKAEDVKINERCCCVNSDDCLCSSRVLPARFRDQWRSKGSLNLLVSHGDCVCKLPPNSTLLASSVSCNAEVFLSGRNENIIACQSHPEMEYQYSVVDRIWPVVVDQRNRLNEEEKQVAIESFQKYTGEDAREFLDWISDFLHSE